MGHGDHAYEGTRSDVEIGLLTLDVVNKMVELLGPSFAVEVADAYALLLEGENRKDGLGQMDTSRVAPAA